MQTLEISHKVIKEALLIRKVEEKFLSLFSEGRLNGTVHTCVGQEFSALAFAGQLKKKDFVFSNHRCHGHYIAFTGDVRGLLAELLGRRTGTCGGIGSSQHLCNNNFYSNGIQGGIVPVAAGYALGNKMKSNGAVGIVYIGDGTLGEGVLYETMNIISKWNIPLLIVCENNKYAQSTPQSVNLSGNILDRPQAFGIKTYHGNTWRPDELINQARKAIDFVREEIKPAFFLVDTYRLNAHSKGDDDREPEEIRKYRERDPLNIFINEEPTYYKIYMDSINSYIDQLVDETFLEQELPLEDYFINEELNNSNEWHIIEPNKNRQVELINQFFKTKISTDEKLVLLGEDILSPYGGAFKVMKELSALKPEQVFSTPISEAAIMGISNGLALNGFKPFAEIMFGDFVTLAFDQIVNHASKFHHMFNKKVNCPVVLRTPMGGRRGYGPTHSQTLDKFLIGIDNVKTVAVNTLFDPRTLYEAVYMEKHPVLIIENKTDYGKRILSNQSKYFNYQINNDRYPVVKVSPIGTAPTITMIAYGGMADIINGILEEIFHKTDWIPELIVPSLISDLPYEIIKSSLKTSTRLLVIEEGSIVGGIGSEIVATLIERCDFPIKARRIGALPVPIPSVKSLENIILPEKERIISEIKECFN